VLWKLLNVTVKFALRQSTPLKDLLQKMPLGKLSSPAYAISRKRSANQQKQSRNDALHVKTSQSAKNQLDPAKNKNWPKMLQYCAKVTQTNFDEFPGFSGLFKEISLETIFPQNFPTFL